MRSFLLVIFLIASSVLPLAADIYVACLGTDSVKAYTKSGVPIGSGDFITGLDDPYGIVLVGTTLFVTNNGNGNVSAYGTNGTLVAANFFLPANAPGVYGIASDGNRVAIANLPAGTVSTYSAATGVAISMPPLVSGLSSPRGVAVSGNTVFIANTGAKTVIARDASTGAAVPGFTSITGFTEPRGLAISEGRLYVSDFRTGFVGVYNATTGATIDAELIKLGGPLGIKVVGNRLYVAAPGAGTVGVYDATSGAAINASLITGLNNPYDIAIAPEPAAKVVVKGRMTFSTTKPSTLLKGTANAATTRVQVKVGNQPYRTAQGGRNWSFSARLSMGRNVIRVRGLNADGKWSPVARLTVTRMRAR